MPDKTDSNDEQKKPSGKGRATPPRKQQEALNKRPAIGNRSPEAKKAAKEIVNAERRKAREGMAAGDDKFLTVRDRGPQRRMARDLVDSRFTVGELVLPALFLVIIISSVPSYEVQLATLIAMWTLFVAIAVDGYFIGKKVQLKLTEKFGTGKVEKGLRWYAAMRSIQMRAMRLPKPQVKRGTKIS
jgi:hypothetical protein